MQADNYKEQYFNNGFAVVDDVFAEKEIEAILNEIRKVNTDNPVFRKSNDLFAIRQFLKQVPETIPFIFTEKVNDLIDVIFGKDNFVVKSIYFDKPGQSNWFVAYHQDLTISVKEKINIEGFGPWTVKQDQFAVQPPLKILENNFTIRIHLDDTTEANGALKVIPGSHLKGIVRPDTIKDIDKEALYCPVRKGAVMFMSPLLLHASNKTTNNKNRRVIHIEFSNQTLPEGLSWSEYLNTRDDSFSHFPLSNS